MSTSFEPDKRTSGGQTIRLLGEEAQAGGLLRPFKVRNYCLLFGGQAVSTIGDALYMVALPWLILTGGGGAQELGIVLTAYGIPRISGILLGGWLSDRIRPRWLMLLADVVRAVLVGMLAAQAFWGHPALWQLCVVAIPLGLFQGLFLPANQSILPEILADDDLQAGNALSFTSAQGALLVGASVGGVIVAALNSGLAMAVDALTFVVSAISLAMMRVAVATTTREHAENATNLAGTGAVQREQVGFWHYLRTSRPLQIGLSISIVANFCLGGLMEVALPVLAHGPFHAGASGYGLIIAALGAGTLGGGVVAGMLGKLKRKGLLALLTALFMAGNIALVPYAGLSGAILFMLIAGIASSFTNILFLTAFQLTIPHHLMGRAMSLLLLASYGSYPISVALAGAFSSQIGPAILFPFSGLLLALAVLFGLTQRELRDL